MDNLPVENEDLDSQEPSTTEVKESEEENIEEKRKTLLSKVLSGNLITTREKVAFILNRFSKTRNSDIELAWDYWATFQSNTFDGRTINKSQLNALTRLSTLTRERAKIQNVYKLFQADDLVKKYRGVLETEKKNNAIEDRPADLPQYSVFIDESGKTQDHLLVGSLWVVDAGISSYKVSLALREWKEQKDISYEFHFKEVKNHKFDAYKEFFLKFLSLNASIGFKIIVVKNSGFSNTQQAITDLTFHLVNKGINHENETSRAPLPRILQIWLDDEETGADKLKLENLRERFANRTNEGLYLGAFEAISSENNFYIQAVDLFTASVNRKLNSPEGTNIKDELANFILETLNFDFNTIDVSNPRIDNSTIFNLSDFEN